MTTDHGSMQFPMLFEMLSGPEWLQYIPISRSHIPRYTTALDTSNGPQNHVGNHLGLYITPVQVNLLEARQVKSLL